MAALTGRRRRRLRRLVNRAARAWSIEDRRMGFSTKPAWAYREHLHRVVRNGGAWWVEKWAVTR